MSMFGNGLSGPTEEELLALEAELAEDEDDITSDDIDLFFASLYEVDQEKDFQDVEEL